MTSFKMATKALYYPTIHFQSLDWLKCALLYWEGVRRIVPHKDYPTRDNASVVGLKRRGLIEDEPATEYRAAATDKFTPKLEALLRARGEQVVGWVDRAAKQARGGKLKDSAQVHALKMDERLVKYLQESGIARQAGDWLEMGSDVAGLYMMALAGEAATALNSPMVTEHPDCDVASIYLNTKSGTSVPEADNFAMARLICPLPRPESLRDIGIEQILDIRKELEGERRRFRGAVQAIADDVAGLSSPRAVKDAVEDRRAEIRDAIKSQREALDEAHVGSFWGLMSVSIPSAIPALTPHLDSWEKAIGAGAIMAFGYINWFGKRRSKARKLREDCPWHYLISLEKRFPGKVSHEFAEFRTNMDQLVYD